jgi:hypothetical protein
LTGSPGRPGQFFLNQNNVILVKKKNKNQRVATWFFTGSCRVSRVTPGFFFPYFFFNPARFQSRVDPPGRVEF